MLCKTNIFTKTLAGPKVILLKPVGNVVIFHNFTKLDLKVVCCSSNASSDVIFWSRQGRRFKGVSGKTDWVSTGVSVNHFPLASTFGNIVAKDETLFKMTSFRFAAILSTVFIYCECAPLFD